MTRLHRLCLLLASVLLATLRNPLTVHAEQVQQRLERSASKVNFSATSGFLTSSGTLTDYSAELTVDPLRPTNSHLVLTVNPTSFSLNGASEQQVLLFRTLVASLHQGPLRFESSQVTKVSDKSLSIRGVTRSGAQSYQLSVPVKIVELSAKRSRFTGVLRSDDGDSAKPFAVQSLSGEVQFDLVFIAA